LRLLGVVLVVGGLVFVVGAFVRFAVGGGTPAPVAPPPGLVVEGAYRWVRNPMYVATAAVIVGEGLLLGQPVLFVAAAVYLLGLAGLVRWVEEPRLRARFGDAYARYVAEVPPWMPRRPARRALPASGGVADGERLSDDRERA
jgi:protein-S-isoprenylcysteine O-methyltransferase Ste14